MGKTGGLKHVDDVDNEEVVTLSLTDDTVNCCSICGHQVTLDDSLPVRTGRRICLACWHKKRRGAAGNGSGGKNSYSEGVVVKANLLKICPLCNHPVASGGNDSWSGGKRPVHSELCLRKVFLRFASEAGARELTEANFLDKSAAFIKKMYRSLATEAIDAAYQARPSGKQTLFTAEMSLLDSESELIGRIKEMNLFLEREVSLEKLFHQATCAYLSKLFVDVKTMIKTKADEPALILEKINDWHQRLGSSNYRGLTRKLLTSLYQELIMEALKFERDIESMEELCLSTQDDVAFDLADDLFIQPEIDLMDSCIVVLDLVKDYVNRYYATEMAVLEKVNTFFELGVNFDRLLAKKATVKIKNRSLGSDLIINSDYGANLAEVYQEQVGEEVLSLSGKRPKSYGKRAV